MRIMLATLKALNRALDRELRKNGGNTLSPRLSAKAERQLKKELARYSKDR